MLSVLPVQTQQIQGKIVIDVGHSSLDVQKILNELVHELEINYYNVEFTETILYLDPYDVLVIAIPTEPFTGEELNSIHSFVENGGGLLLMGESGALSSKNVEDFNMLAKSYGVEYQRDVVVDPSNNLTLDKAYPEIPIIENFASHAVTKNVYRIFLVSGCSLRLTSKAHPIAWGGEETYGDRLSEIYGFGGGAYEPEMEKKGEDLIVMAVAESKKGRVVALGDTTLFRGQSTAGEPWPADPFDYLDHKRLALNIFSWLSLKTRLSSAVELLDEAQDLVEDGEYQEAEDLLEEVKSIATQAKEFDIVRQARSLLMKTSRGIEADMLFEEGKEKLANLDYEGAAKSFEMAFTIYENLGNIKKIEECSRFLAECGDKEALRAKADLLFSEGEALFEQLEYSEAIEKILEAKAIYENLNVNVKAELCDSLIEKIQNSQQGKPQEDVLARNRLVLAVIILATAAIVAILFLWRRSKSVYEDMEESHYR
jgi:tetratricopeptide (TPR) repeat protein